MLSASDVRAAFAHAAGVLAGGFTSTVTVSGLLLAGAAVAPRVFARRLTARAVAWYRDTRRPDGRDRARSVGRRYQRQAFDGGSGSSPAD